MIDVTLKQLRYALSLAESGHFGRAADKCHVTQPALSQQIAHLEAACGTKLFERRSGKVIPTPFGRDFLDHARRTVAEADSLIGFATARSGRPDRAVRFGLIPTVAPYLLPEVYPALQKGLPDIRFTISESQTDWLIDGLDSGAIDTALIATDPPPGARLLTAPLFADPFVLATARLRAVADPVALKIFRPEEILLLEEGHCFRDQAIDACDLNEDETGNAFAATSLSTIVEFVAAGQGITLLPTISLKKEAADPRIAIHTLAAPGASRELRLAWRTGSPFSTLFEKIAAIIRTEGQQRFAQPIQSSTETPVGK